MAFFIYVVSVENEAWLLYLYCRFNNMILFPKMAAIFNNPELRNVIINTHLNGIKRHTCYYAPYCETCLKIPIQFSNLTSKQTELNNVKSLLFFFLKTFLKPRCMKAPF